jgi:hypothetical protein
MQLTRQQTALVEQGRNLDFWRLLNHYLPENSEGEDIYLEIDAEYQALESQIDEEEVMGTDANGESYILQPFPDRKPPITKPTFPF